MQNRSAGIQIGQLLNLMLRTCGGPDQSRSGSYNRMAGFQQRMQHSEVRWWAVCTSLSMRSAGGVARDPSYHDRFSSGHPINIQRSPVAIGVEISGIFPGAIRVLSCPICGPRIERGMSTCPAPLLHNRGAPDTLCVGRVSCLPNAVGRVSNFCRQPYIVYPETQ
jgi:hypothetical protein